MSAALDLAIKLTLLDLASQGIKNAAGQFKALAAAGDETRKHFDNMIDSAKIAAGSLLVGRAIYGAMQPGVTAAADMQLQVIAIKNELYSANKPAAALAAEMAEIKKTAFDIQAWTPFDQTGTLAMLNELQKAGLSVVDIVGKTGAGAATAALATLEKIDPSLAAGLLASAATPFQIGGERYMELADLFVRAASASRTSAIKIGEGFKFVAGTSAGLHRPIKEMLALTGMMSNVGLDSTTAGTALDNFFRRAAKYEKFVDSKGNLKPTKWIAQYLRERFGRMGDSEQTTGLEEIFGAEGVRAAKALLNEGKGGFEFVLQGMDSALPIQERIVALMGAFSNQIEGLKGTSKSILADLFTPALSPATAIVAKVNELVAGMGKLAAANPSLGQSLTYAGGAAIAGTALVGGAALIQAVLSGRKALAGVGGAGRATFDWAGVMSPKSAPKGLGALWGRLGGTALGVGQGLAIQAATGVNPVYVTNASEIGNGLGSSASVVGSVVSLKGILDAVKVLAGAGFVTALSGGIGVIIGSLVNKGLSEAISSLTHGSAENLGELVHDMAAPAYSVPKSVQAAMERSTERALKRIAAPLVAGGSFEAMKLAEGSGDDALYRKARNANAAKNDQAPIYQQTGITIYIDKDREVRTFTTGTGATKVRVNRGPFYG